MLATLKRHVRVRMARYCAPRVRCLFVLSTGRVGTTSLTSILSLSPGIHAVHEPAPMFNDETRDAYMEPARNGSWPVAKQYSANRAPVLLRCVMQDRLYAETSNRLTYIAADLAGEFPLAKFVHLHRNPADVVRSCMRRGYYEHHVGDQYRIRPIATDRYYADWPNWNTFQKSCWYWQAVNQVCLTQLAAIGKERTMTIGFDELLAGSQTSEALFAWLGIKPPDSRAITEVLKVPENSQRQGTFPKWNDWTELQKQTLKDITLPVAQTLGYFR